MRLFPKIVVASLVVMASNPVFSQEDVSEVVPESEQLKIAAIEMLISAPEERALPLLEKVLSEKHSDTLKSRALFILSQFDDPQAQVLLLESTRNGSPELRAQAIRMIGISGDTAALDGRWPE